MCAVYIEETWKLKHNKQTWNVNRKKRYVGRPNDRTKEIRRKEHEEEEAKVKKRRNSYWNTRSKTKSTEKDVQGREAQIFLFIHVPLSSNRSVCVCIRRTVWAHLCVRAVACLSVHCVRALLLLLFLHFREFTSCWLVFDDRLKRLPLVPSYH